MCYHYTTGHYSAGLRTSTGPLPHTGINRERRSNKWEPCQPSAGTQVTQRGETRASVTRNHLPPLPHFRTQHISIYERGGKSIRHFCKLRLTYFGLIPAVNSFFYSILSTLYFRLSTLSCRLDLSCGYTFFLLPNPFPLLPVVLVGPVGLEPTTNGL